MPERLYERLGYRLNEIEHRYGDGVHILADPCLLTLLNRLCSPATRQPELGELLAECYSSLLLSAFNNELPRARVERETRMITHTPAGRYRGDAIDPASRVVSVCLARAGIMPSQMCFDLASRLLDPERQRQDHVYVQRTVDAQGHVTGAHVMGAKVHTIDGAFVVIPDPMGATGSSVLRVLDHYRKEFGGKPARVIAVHLIVTPEYIRAVRTAHPDARIYAIRLDRGLSPEPVLATPPGTQWDKEVGLNDHQYIVPGAGGLGELLNNAPG